MSSPNKKRLIQNLLLMLVVAGLVFFIIMKKDDNGDLHQTLYDKSIGDNAKEVVIHSEGREDVVLQNNDTVWSVVKPTQFLADKAKVHHLFTLLSENADSQYDAKGKDLVAYGLDKDRLSVSFNGVKIIFGKLNEVTQKRFLLKNGTIYLVQETVSGLLQMGEDAFKPMPKPTFTRQKPE